MKILHRLARLGTIAVGLPVACKHGGSLSGYTQIPATSLRDLLAGDPGLLLVDVRTPAEWVPVRVPGVKEFIPHDQISERVSELGAQPEKPIYLICRSGHRSSVAVASLAKLGYKQAFSVEGGTNAWVAAGYPTESGPIPK